MLCEQAHHQMSFLLTYNLTREQVNLHQRLLPTLLGAAVVLLSGQRKHFQMTWFP